MARSRTLMAFIGRTFPAVHHVIPRAGQAVELFLAADQPLPPVRVGTITAEEILRIASIGETFHLDLKSFDEGNDWCPTWPKRPHLPPGRIPAVPPEPGQDWLLGYHLGLASTLTAAEVELRGTPSGELAGHLAGRSMQALDTGLAERL